MFLKILTCFGKGVIGLRECIKNDLKTFLQAKIECIWIQTKEEAKVVEDIRELKISLKNIPKIANMELHSWSITEGVSCIPDNNYEKIECDSKIKEFPMLFSYIKKKQAVSQNIWLLRDLHIALKDPKCQRFIRDLKEYEGLYNPLIVISPECNIPGDIAHLFKIIQYDLPSEEEIRKTIVDTNDALVSMKTRENDSIHIASDEEIAQAVKACKGLTLKEIEMALRESVVRLHAIDPSFLANTKVELVKKTGVLDYVTTPITFKDIGGNRNIKNWLEDSKIAFSAEARDFGVDRPKGFVAVGIPGCGKTLLANAFANELHIPMLEFSISKIMNKLVGESERKIDQALQVARACAPCVLLFDEVEKMLSNTGGGQNDGGVTNRVLQSILKFMNEDTGVYVVMTSNDISQLPPEFTRAGRVDAIWYFGLPSDEERKEIFRVHFGHKNRNVTDEVLSTAVEKTQGYTGAEIQQVVKNAMLKAFNRYKKDGNKEITIDDILYAAKSVVPISQSSREKIAALENFCRTRARMASETQTATEKTDKVEDSFLLDF